MPYDLGDRIGATFTVRDAYDNVTNAGTVTATVTLPDGSVAAATVSDPPPSTGTYLVEATATLPGRYVLRLVTTGPVTAHVDVADVRPPNPAYLISLADAKAHVNIAAAVTTHDEELRSYIEAATWAVEDQLGRVVVRRSVTETVWGCRSVHRIALTYHPVVNLTSVTPLCGGQAYDVDNFDVDEHGIVTALSTRLFGDVRFGYVAGEAVVPANYALAARIIVAHLWETQRGTTGGAPRFGGSEGAGGYTPSGFALPKRALELLGGRPPMVG